MICEIELMYYQNFERPFDQKMGLNTNLLFSSTKFSRLAVGSLVVLLRFNHHKSYCKNSQTQKQSGFKISINSFCILWLTSK